MGMHIGSGKRVQSYGKHKADRLWECPWPSSHSGNIGQSPDEV